MVYRKYLPMLLVLGVAYGNSCVSYKYRNVFILFYLYLTFIKGPVYTLCLVERVN